MASLAETLIGGFQEHVKAPDLYQSYNDAADLALKKEAIDQQQQQIEQHKQDLQNKKLDKFATSIQQASKLDSSTRKMYTKNVLPKLRDALGLTDMFPDESFNFMVGSDQNLARSATLISDVKRGKISQAEAVTIAQDPEKFVKLYPQFIGDQNAGPIDISSDFVNNLGKAETVHVQAEAQAQKQAAQQQFTHGENEAKAGRVGQQELDKKFAKDFADYQASGGRATAEKSIGLLQDAINDLAKPGEQASKTIAGFAGDKALDVIDPKLAATRDKIRSAIQSTLKQVLGAQFTSQEGEAIFSRAFNPRLSDAENIRRATVELNALKQMVHAKDAAGSYFDEHQTLKGFNGAISQSPTTQTAKPAPTDLYPTLKLDSYQKLSPAAKGLLQKKTGMSDAEIKSHLGGE